MPKYQIYVSASFSEWFATLTEKTREAIFVKVELLKDKGPQLGRPHADTLYGSNFGNMKELRVGTIRIAYAFDQKRQGILLVGGDKKGADQGLFYESLISKADRLFAE